MRLNQLLLATFCFASVGCIACQDKEDEDRPGGIDIGGVMGPAPTPKGDGDGDGTVLGDGSAHGVVEQFATDSFDASTAYPGSAAVTISNLSAVVRVETIYDGVDFVAEGDILGDRWIYVDPDEDVAYPTLSRHIVGLDELLVPVVASGVLDLIFQNLTTPTAMSTTLAQLMIQVVDGANNGVSGVRADAFAASPPNVAYKQNAVWSTSADATTSEGLAFIPNLESPRYPGQVLQVILTGAIDHQEDVRLAGGAITLMTVVVP